MYNALIGQVPSYRALSQDKDVAHTIARCVYRFGAAWPEAGIPETELLGELNRDRSLRLRCGKITSWVVFRPAVS